MKPTIMYNGNITPYAVIKWFVDGEARYRTICYDDTELVAAIQRRNTPGDFYYRMPYQIVMHTPEPDLVAA